jgi:multicomponent Na+:H+ antiporter subunit A
LALAVLSLLLLAMLAPLVHRWVGDRTGMLLALLPAGLFAYFLSQLPALADGGVVLTESPWLPGLGVTLAFRLDGLACCSRCS